MKILGFSLLIALALAAVPAAAQDDHEAEWKEYVYAQHGIAKEFPGQPITNIDEYNTEVVGEPMRSIVIFTELGDVTTQMTVVKFEKEEHLAKAANIKPQ